ncbi:MAG: glycosyltransferase, partial [Candidatus Hodarchaeota archaeon]
MLLSLETIILNFIYLSFEIIISSYTIYMILILYNALHFEKYYTKPLKRIDNKRNAVFVSIILPIKDIDPKVVESSLKALFTQTYPLNLYEVILATNSADKYYLDAYRTLSKKFNTKFIKRNPELTGFKAGVLNDALQVIKGEYFIVHDADHEPRSNYIEILVNTFENLPPKIFKKTAYIQARTTFSCDFGFLQKST